MPLVTESDRSGSRPEDRSTEGPLERDDPRESCWSVCAPFRRFSSCRQPNPCDRANEPTEGCEADYPVVTLELRTEIETRLRVREPLPRNTPHNAPERHGRNTEEQREHASVPYKLDRPNREPHGGGPQRVVEQLHKSEPTSDQRPSADQHPGRPKRLLLRRPSGGRGLSCSVTSSRRR